MPISVSDLTSSFKCVRSQDCRTEECPSLSGLPRPETEIHAPDIPPHHSATKRPAPRIETPTSRSRDILADKRDERGSASLLAAALGVDIGLGLWEGPHCWCNQYTNKWTPRNSIGQTGQLGKQEMEVEVEVEDITGKHPALRSS